MYPSVDDDFLKNLYIKDATIQTVKPNFNNRVEEIEELKDQIAEMKKEKIKSDMLIIKLYEELGINNKEIKELKKQHIKDAFK